MVDQATSDEISCETQGHLWGWNDLCVMCKAPKPKEAAPSKQVSIDLEVGRDPDGDVHISIYADRKNQLSISASEQGHLNWAGVVNGVSHHNVVTDALGTIIYRLLNGQLPPEPEANDARNPL